MRPHHKAPGHQDITGLSRQELIQRLLAVNGRWTFQFDRRWLERQWTSRLRTLLLSCQPTPAETVGNTWGEVWRQEPVERATETGQDVAEDRGRPRGAGAEAPAVELTRWWCRVSIARFAASLYHAWARLNKVDHSRG